MEDQVTSIPVQNWRRLEEYIKEARQLKAAGTSFLHSRNYSEAFVSLRGFQNLVQSLKQHRAANMPQYRKELFALDNAAKEVQQGVQICLAHTHGRTTRPTRLRPVSIPEELIDRFIALSMTNTERDIETLAILAGQQVGEEFKIDGLVIPPQRGRADACECTDDEALFAALEANQWQVIGWIHTHPRHHLFLSSVDVHTHCHYQYFLPEAIAIVYSPLVAHHQLAIYRLSGPGLQNVRNCQREGFHAGHEEDFGEATHVTVTKRGGYQMVDLRDRRG